MEELQNNNIIIGDYSIEMKDRYLEYAMSVIAGRALPDVRDGLKPVHLRILYSMYELGLMPDKGYRKCARIVGDCLGKYHPHGDQSVYDALVRMAQPWSLRYPLVDGHGNFGSVDGDSAAAMRYTESKLSKLALEMLRDINKDTIKFRPNFDGEEQEPCVLTSRFPNLLANGSDGIAVGMATSIPSHNLNELIDGFTFLIDNPQATIEEINKYILCPDFATGGTIINPDKIKEVYETGRGSITIRSKYHIENNIDEKTKKTIKSIVFTEIPYQTNKAKICANIAELIESKDEILGELLDIRDESDKDGMRIVVDIKPSTDESIVLARLFQKTQLQKNFNSIFCVIVNNEPKILNLKQIMEHYINFQKEIITNRSKFDLDKSQKRLHILEGLRVAILNMDKTIELIRSSKSKNEAKEKLISQLSLDEEQSQSILDMRLHRLTGLEIQSIQNEYDDLIKIVSNLNLILTDNNKLLEVLKSELLEVKEKYGDERRTQLLYEDTIREIKKEDLIREYSVTMVLTKQQYLKKTLKYSEIQKLKEDDEVLQLLQTNNTRDLLLFTDKGRVFTRKIYELIGTVECTAGGGLGEYIPNILKDNLDKDEKIIYIVSPESYDKGYMLYIYENNNIVKMSIKPYFSPQNRMKPQDAYNTESPLKYIKYIEKDIDILTLSSEGKMLIQNTEGINPKTSQGGKKSQGNSFVKLDDNDLVGVVFEPKEDDIIRFKTEKKDCVEINLSDICQSSKDKLTYYNHCKGKKNNSGSFIYNCRQKNDSVIEVVFS